MSAMTSTAASVASDVCLSPQSLQNVPQGEMFTEPEDWRMREVTERQLKYAIKLREGLGLPRFNQVMTRGEMAIEIDQLCSLEVLRAEATEGADHLQEQLWYLDEDD